MFRRMDADGSGTLDVKELRAAFVDLGFGADTPAVAQAIAQLEASGSSGLDVKEFKALVKAVKVGSGPPPGLVAPPVSGDADGYEGDGGEAEGDAERGG